jgi:hypothetical protein
MAHTSSLAESAGRFTSSRALRVQQPCQPGGVDGDLESLLSVHLHDRDPDPVLELELVVPLDVDLVEREPEPLSQGKDRLPGNVAEMTAGTRVEDDPMAPDHGADGSVPRRDR